MGHLVGRSGQLGIGELGRSGGDRHRIRLACCTLVEQILDKPGRLLGLFHGLSPVCNSRSFLVLVIVPARGKTSTLRSIKSRLPGHKCGAGRCRVSARCRQGGNGIIATISRRNLLAGYVIWMTLLVAVYYAVPGLRAESWGLLGLSGVLAIVAGVVINRPARALPWLLLAAANLSFVAGQVSFLILTTVLRVNVPFPSFADVLYLSTYPLYAIGVFIFIRWRTAGSDRRSLIDALTLTAGLGLLSWLYLILPYAHNSQLSWLQKCFSMAYPLGDVLVLAMLARLLAPGPMKARSVQLLTFGTIGLLAADVSYGLIQLHGTFHNGTIVDLGWAIFYSAWGAAALHPSMADLTRPVARRSAEVSPLRLALLMLASLIAPGVLFIESQIHGDTQVYASVIAVFSAILYLLVLSRLWDVARSHRRALARERVVRQAGASLASAV